jgi:hypothetical protein
MVLGFRSSFVLVICMFVSYGSRSWSKMCTTNPAPCSNHAHYYPDSQNKAGVVFNVVGEVRGLISDKCVSVDYLSENPPCCKFFRTNSPGFRHTHLFWPWPSVFLHVFYFQAEHMSTGRVSLHVTTKCLWESFSSDQNEFFVFAWKSI